jgi:hypothetical protein
MSIEEVTKGPGRALVQPPRGRDLFSSSLRSSTPTVPYRESEQRQSEQDEARAVRVAMEDLELAKEGKLFEAARDEAAELVYKHRNPDAPGGPNSAYPYPGLARKGSTQRSRSVEPKDQDLQRANSKIRKRHSIGSASAGSRSSSLQSNGSNSPVKEDFEIKNKSEEPSSLRKAINDLPNFGQRRKSSGSRRKISGSLFSDPNDKIYEEPEEETQVAPAPTPVADEPKADKQPLGIRRNPFMRFQSVKGNPMIRSNTDPVMGNKRFDRYEIQKNPPTQMRNAAYTLNPTLPMPAEFVKADAENEPEIKMKDGKEIRSDDLRAATGFRLRDRSPKLPTPTMVSDSPGRPIVSFQKGYNEIELKEDVYGSTEAATRPSIQPNQQAPGTRPLSNAVTSPAVPTMNTVEERPKKTFTPPPVPTINVPSSTPVPSSRSIPAAVPAISMSSSTSTPLSSRFNRPEKPAINVYEDSPARPLPSNILRKFNGPPPATAPSRPTINVSQAPSMYSQSVSTSAIPTISGSNTPSISVNRPGSSRGYTTNGPTVGITPSIPSISVNDNRPGSSRGYTTNSPSTGVTPPIPSISVNDNRPGSSRGYTSNVPSIGVTPPIPSISVSESPAPSRGRNVQVPSISVTPQVPSISVNEAPASNRGPKINAPSISVTPSVPTINVNGAGSTRPLPTPTINVNGAGGSARPMPTPPTISVNGAGGSTRPMPTPPAINVSGARGSTRPLPDPKNHSSRPFGREGATNTRPHWTPTNARTGALCTQCALPIAGRIVSAAGLRFHPECFACYQCGEHLECVAFYPEPDNKLAERVSRIRARQCGQDIAFLPTYPTADDMARLEHEDGTDESQRFFCHLDFHEMFSPRCKSCKTPIEGEVIVACGAEWHAGHFFCAQCGDPFDSSTPFVEKDGYAWCVNCHTHRYSTKCKKCRKPVTDTVVKALGAEWHMGCFCCMVSQTSCRYYVMSANKG